MTLFLRNAYYSVSLVLPACQGMRVNNAWSQPRFILETYGLGAAAITLLDAAMTVVVSAATASCELSSELSSALSSRSSSQPFFCMSPSHGHQR